MSAPVTCRSRRSAECVSPAPTVLGSDPRPSRPAPVFWPVWWPPDARAARVRATAVRPLGPPAKVDRRARAPRGPMARLVPTAPPGPTARLEPTAPPGPTGAREPTAPPVKVAPAAPPVLAPQEPTARPAKAAPPVL